MKNFLLVLILAFISSVVSAVHVDQENPCDEIEQLFPGNFLLEKHERDSVIKRETVAITIDKVLVGTNHNFINFISSKISFDVPLNLDVAAFFGATITYNPDWPFFCGIAFKKNDNSGSSIGLGMRVQRVGTHVIFSDKSGDSFWLLRKLK